MSLHAQVEVNSNELSSKVDSVVSRTNQLNLERWYWSEAVAWHGLMRVYLENSQPQALAKVQTDINDLLNAEVPAEPKYGLTYAPPDASHIMQLNDLPTGISSLLLYDLTGQSKYYPPCEASAEAAMNWDKTSSNGAYLHWNSTGYDITTHAYKDWVWVDSVYMLVPFLCEMFETTGDTDYLDRASNQFILHADLLQDTNTGLVYHGWGEAEGTNGIFWGRGNGWFYAAAIDLLDTLPANHPDRNQILSLYRTQTDGLVAAQKNNGLWNQVLDDPDSWTETTGSAAFCYGILKGIRLGYLDSNYTDEAQACTNGLLASINQDGSIQNASAGAEINTDPTYYDNIDKTGTYDYAQGLTLLFLSELLQTQKLQELPDTGKIASYILLIPAAAFTTFFLLIMKARKTELKTN
jgi:unsaturated rhamnogalacturonyl hydrolase